MEEREKLRRVVVYDLERYICRRLEEISDSLEILASLDRQRNMVIAELGEAVVEASRRLGEVAEALSKLTKAIEEESRKVGEDREETTNRRRRARKRRAPPPEHSNQMVSEGVSGCG